jgi:hypothetical protein
VRKKPGIAPPIGDVFLEPDAREVKNAAFRLVYLFWAFSGVTLLEERIAERPNYDQSASVLEQLADVTHRGS